MRTYVSLYHYKSEKIKKFINDRIGARPYMKVSAAALNNFSTERLSPTQKRRARRAHKRVRLLKSLAAEKTNLLAAPIARTKSTATKAVNLKKFVGNATFMHGIAARPPLGAIYARDPAYNVREITCRSHKKKNEVFVDINDNQILNQFARLFTNTRRSVLFSDANSHRASPARRKVNLESHLFRFYK